MADKVSAKVKSYQSKSQSDSLDPDKVRQIEQMYARKGRIVRIPTVAEILRRHQWAKAWWGPRDVLISTTTAMARLENPFTDDKDARADHKVRVGPSGRVEYSVAPFPFDVQTLAQSLVEDRYPYTLILPAAKAHQNENVLEDFDKFAQAALDIAMEQSDFKSNMIVKSMVTGWLVSLYTLDPHLLEQEQFPFDMQILDPIDVYPQLNAQRKPIWATVVNRVTGTQLLEEYGMYPGVRELFDDEPGGDSFEYGTSTYNRYWEHGNNIWTTEFDIIRFWDDCVTVLLVGATDASPGACGFNPTLKYLKEKSRKGRYASVLESSDPDTLDDNPYAGIFQHNMGGIPINIEGCWPEPVGPESRNLMSGDIQRGRIGWFPFMYSQIQPWLDTSQMDSMLHTMMMDAADPQLFTTSESITASNADSKILRGMGDEKAMYLPRPPISQEFTFLAQRMEQRSQNALFGAGAYGASAGTSGRQQNERADAGTSRLGKPVNMMERASASYPRAIAKTMIHRGGDEKLFLSGNGEKYLSGSYAKDFSFDKLGKVVPRIFVQLLAKEGLKNPENVSIANSLKGFLPKKYIWRHALDIVNADQLWKDEREEAVAMDKNVVMPQLEIATLKAQLEAGKDKAKLSWQVQQMQDEIQHENDKRQAELDLSQLPEEELIAKQRAFIEQKMMEVSTPPGQNQQAGGQGPFSLGNGPGLTSLSPTSGPLSAMGQPQPRMPGILPTAPLAPAMNVPPPGMPGPGGLPNPADLGRRVATAPGQAQQPIQPLSRYQPAGGVGTTGVPSNLVGPQGLPGQPAYLPGIEAANQALRPIGPLPAPTLGSYRNGRRKRGRRG